MKIEDLIKIREEYRLDEIGLSNNIKRSKDNWTTSQGIETTLNKRGEVDTSIAMEHYYMCILY
ncbi:MAG: hypothetical protein WC781_01035 [Candidatus Pacearchaeota archaeon]|jgi:hypothetical protein